MISRAFAQNLAVIGMLATFQSVRRTAYNCECDWYCSCSKFCDDTAEDAMMALGEDFESATHKEIYG